MRLGSLGLRTWVLAAGLTLAAGSTALAAQRWDNRYDRDWRQTAYDRGYQDGFQQGTHDARGRRAFAYDRDRRYRNADDGYERHYGDRGAYQQAFRQGFVTGYSAGYYGRNPYGGYGNQYPTYGQYQGYGQYPNGRAVPRTPGYGTNDLAWTNGRADGYEKGLEDGRRNRSYQPSRHDRYEDADHGYKKWYGPKDYYRQAYRQAFVNGYDAGYRDGQRGEGRGYGYRRW